MPRWGSLKATVEAVGALKRPLRQEAPRAELGRNSESPKELDLQIGRRPDTAPKEERPTLPAIPRRPTEPRPKGGPKADSPEEDLRIGTAPASGRGSAASGRMRRQGSLPSPRAKLVGRQSSEVEQLIVSDASSAGGAGSPVSDSPVVWVSREMLPTLAPAAAFPVEQADELDELMDGPTVEDLPPHPQSRERSSSLQVPSSASDSQSSESEDHLVSGLSGSLTERSRPEGGPDEVEKTKRKSGRPKQSPSGPSPNAAEKTGRKRSSSRTKRSSSNVSNATDDNSPGKAHAAEKTGKKRSSSRTKRSSSNVSNATDDNSPGKAHAAEKAGSKRSSSRTKRSSSNVSNATDDNSPGKAHAAEKTGRKRSSSRIRSKRSQSTCSDLEDASPRKHAARDRSARRMSSSSATSAAASDPSSVRRSSRSSSPSERRRTERKRLRARLTANMPERKTSKVSFLRKAWSQARCALLGLREPEVEDDNDPRAKGLRGWDAARALRVGTGAALNHSKNIIHLVKQAAEEAYHRHAVQKAIIEEIGGTLRGSMANVSTEMDETIGDVLADLTRLKWLEMTEVGALICEAVLNFEEEEGVTSPESLRDELLKHVQSLPEPEEQLGMDDVEIENLLDGIMHKVEDLRDQLRKSASFTLPKPRADEEGKRHSRLRELKTHLEGVDTLEETREERESVQSILMRMDSAKNAPGDARAPGDEVPPPATASTAAAPAVEWHPTAPSGPRGLLRRPMVRGVRRSDASEEELDLQVSPSSSKREQSPVTSPKKELTWQPQPQTMELVGFPDAAGFLEVSKRSVLYAAMTTFPYMQRFPAVLAQQQAPPELRQVSDMGSLLPLLVVPRPLSPARRQRHSSCRAK